MMRIRGAMSAVAAGAVIVAIAACGDEGGRVQVTKRADVPARQVVAVSSVVPASTAGRSVAGPGSDSASSPVRNMANVSYGDAERVYRSGDYGAAADLFQAYATKHPDNPWGHYMLGIAAWKAGDHGRAEAALRRTLQVAPRNAKALVNLARVLLEEGKASDALEPAEQVVALDSATGAAWRVLGNVRSELGQVDSAVSAYRRALVLDPLDAWTMNNLGLLMIRDGRYEDALPSLARATELRPDVAVFQNNLGVALERSGHLGDAAVAYRAALAVHPVYAKARTSLERVEAIGTMADAPPADLPALARAFADQVTEWRSQVAQRAPTRATVGVVPDSIH
jgi:Flp pilus assembly protein TadD